MEDKRDTECKMKIGHLKDKKDSEGMGVTKNMKFIKIQRFLEDTWKVEEGEDMEKIKKSQAKEDMKHVDYMEGIDNINDMEKKKVVVDM